MFLSESYLQFQELPHRWCHEDDCVTREFVIHKTISKTPRSACSKMEFWR